MMADPTTVDVDPDGDVILVCGAEMENCKVTKLRVSSHVLRLGSPVFKSMLGPHFKEGQLLAANSSIEIPLPDDDPESMTILCRALHLRHFQLRREPAAKTVLKVAIVSDKYDCAEALASSANIWICTFGDDCEYHEACDLLVSAYLFQLPDHFERIGHALTHRWAGDVTMGTTYDVPGDEKLAALFAFLDREHRRLIERIACFINRQIQRRCDLDRKFEGTCIPKCHWAGTYAIAFMRSLRDARLSDTSAELYVGHIADDLLTSMKTMQWKLPKKHEDGFFFPCGNDCFLKDADDDAQVAKAFKDEAKKIEDETNDPCLGCVREGAHMEFSKCHHFVDEFGRLCRREQETL